MVEDLCSDVGVFGVYGFVGVMVDVVVVIVYEQYGYFVQWCYGYGVVIGFGRQVVYWLVSCFDGLC